MTDLETRLRTMLAERAQDIAEAPHWAPGSPLPRRRAHHTVAWLAAAASVLVIAGIAAAIQLTRPSAGPRPTTNSSVPVLTLPPSPTPSLTVPPSPHAIRTASLTSITMKPLPGWTAHMRASEPGYRWLALRKDDDTDVPIGCNGCESASVYVYVYNVGRVNAAALGVSSWPTTTVSGHTGYVGKAFAYGGHQYLVPTLAWQYAPGAWAMVQGVTPAGNAALAQVASAVVPDLPAPIQVPFTLGYVPDLPVISVTDDRSEGYALGIRFGAAPGAASGRVLTIAFWPGAAPPDPDVQTARNRTTIAGVPSWYDRARSIALVPLPGGFLEIGITGANSGPTPADMIETDRILAALRLTPKTLDEAIP